MQDKPTTIMPVTDFHRQVGVMPGTSKKTCQSSMTDRNIIINLSF